MNSFTFCSARSPSSFFKTDDPPDVVDIRVDLELAHPIALPSLSLSLTSQHEIYSLKSL